MSPFSFTVHFLSLRCLRASSRWHRGPASTRITYLARSHMDLAPTHLFHNVLLSAYCMPGAAVPSGTAGGKVDSSYPVIVHQKQRNAIHISAPTWSMNKEGSQRRAFGSSVHVFQAGEEERTIQGTGKTLCVQRHSC